MGNYPDAFDITIIGGGPVGLFTAFYTGMRQASVKIIESLPQLGGQLSALYPEKYIYDIAGFPKIRAQELIDNLIKQMNQFNPSVCLGESVEGIVRLSDQSFAIHTNKGTHYTKAVIITAGNGAFQPRKLNIGSEDKFENKNLHYFVQDLNQFAGKKVVIFGGGDSAVDWALMLEPIAGKVTLIHRRDKFRAHEHSVERLRHSSVEMLTPYIPVELAGAEEIENVMVENTASGETMLIPADDVLVNFGFVSSLGPIKEWGLEIEKNAILVNSKMETNIPGIYAAGDICTYEGKVKLIASGFGEAPTAVSNAKVYIDPGSKVQPLHSTSIMADKEKTGSAI
ncbi:MULTISPECIES: NAD(P)/FAD-dependent oxidoreductase [Cytobacillus]|jgi:ferredoxin/flavodoxin---NADP+ reductase|uniref:Ferredoxin--NADP reductase n=2 Tax=Cytobacillus TaxID=2675230 RepID=A0ABX3CL25_9BACI|nr:MULTISPECIES: NAD(P)/FAD-dependent oxidoreductase [Cytobacillus]EFV75147.1 ferredoxin-NAD(+) reductase [Bacillus sp. 2_A_57_CT2]MBY0158040.1 NAD(P)/FAD-dependent oxidoreductase [Cytobacillus firmus]MBU8731181.1 NAD(P)/FAD-dependent oxidoreductase [Cytobacillus oceanisediminis]MCM3245145.1 NAD(P)/FAD-dependent oxidoreductase [Cytobacillus oceanisediminis]MCM3395287.1 NAD(P)/FAD-dependent oxidoreductase [Cytobacillus oceanisediminis]